MLKSLSPSSQIVRSRQVHLWLLEITRLDCRPTKAPPCFSRAIKLDLVPLPLSRNLMTMAAAPKIPFAAENDPLQTFLTRYFRDVLTSGLPLARPTDLCPVAFPTVTYTDVEKTEIIRWVELSTSYMHDAASAEQSVHSPAVVQLNEYLSTRTTMLGSKPSPADLAVFARLAPAIARWIPEQRTGEHGAHHVIRFIDFVQNSPVFDIELLPEDKVAIDAADVRFMPKPVDPKEEKERKKKEKAAALAAGGAASQAASAKPQRSGGQGGQAGQAGQGGRQGKLAQAKDALADALPVRTSKKEKGAKPQKQPAAAEAKPLSPALIDLRVGHILEAVAHPNADSLYVSTIACGDAPGADNTAEHAASGQTVRTVCSGLNGLVPLAEVQGRRVVVVCNLKPVTMRGVKSAAMVLAASPREAAAGDEAHAGPVELVSPPAGAAAGERVAFEGWAGPPEPVLNPKKKIWEACQAGFTTTPRCEVALDEAKVEGLVRPEGVEAGVRRLVTAAGGACTVASLKGAVVR